MNILNELAKFGFRLSAPPTEVSKVRFCESLDFNLDSDFKEAILASDGANGFVADDVYLQLWPLEDLIALNPYYDDVEICKRLFFFGSDGSSTGYAFVKSTGKVVSIDFIDIGNAEPVEESDSFLDFVRRISA